MAYIPNTPSSLEEYLYDISNKARLRYIEYNKCLEYLQKQEPMRIIRHEEVIRLMNDSFALI